MNDEELLTMYRRYKKKRLIILLIILAILLMILMFIFLNFNNASSDSNSQNNQRLDEEKDEISPIIKLKVNTIEIMKGGDIDYLSYVESVEDNGDGNLIDKLKYEKIDTSKIGEQFIIYYVSDKAGNTSQEVIKVIIKEPEIVQEPTETVKEEEINNQSENNNTKPDNNSNNNQEETNESQTNNNPVVEEPNNSQNKIVKYFLFSDGYTITNVADACATELKKLNRTGMCSPLKDENGIYLGMKLEVN